MEFHGWFGLVWIFGFEPLVLVEGGGFPSSPTKSPGRLESRAVQSEACSLANEVTTSKGRVLL